MPRSNRKTETKSGPENPIAASVHGASHSVPGLLARVKRFFRRLFITLALVVVVVTPFVLYFTDVAPPVRTEMQKRVAEYSLYRKTERELLEANQKIASLEEALASAKYGQNDSRPQPPRPAPVPAPARRVEIEKDDKEPQPKLPVRTKKNEKVTTLRNGVTVRSYVDIGHGETAASVRGRKDAYELETRLRINLPAANRTVSELASLNPDLPKMLPGLKDLLEKGKVSPLFDKIYDLKIERVVKEISSPGEMETRHNFFDCETILALTHPKTKEKVLLMQGEMDVVADGTDGDRWPYLNESIASSKYFQHATSYRWKKKTDTPNPLLARAEKELKTVLARYAVKGLSKAENARLISRRDELRRQIREMQSTSFLIAEVDPFIVLPLSFLNQNKLSHAPSIGDFAVVIYNDKLYPAICGDAGPSWKLGEGSLFLARTLNQKSSPNYRPVSDLKVTYLVFPGTRPDKSVPPDLIDWRNQCAKFLKGIGGLGKGYQLHNWRDLPAERIAMDELEKLVGEFPAYIEKRDKVVAEAKKALASTEEKVAKLNKEVAKLEEQEQKKAAESVDQDSEADELSAEEKKAKQEAAKEERKKAREIRENRRIAEEQKIVFEKALIEAEQSATTARRLHERTRAAIERAQAIAKLPESTPRELSTDIVLTALAETKEAVEILRNE
ncbi:MAG: glycoside hydrolase family 75 protein [Verrucomicrobiales bacterium]|nr:glycoside hydrolase family 75 protein [Verrucomicrobiales bacterium]